MNGRPTSIENALELGFKKARFSEKWLEQNPSDEKREIYARPKRGDYRYWSIWKVGQRTVSTYAQDFIEIL